MAFRLSIIRFIGQREQCIEEPLRLAFEKSGRSQERSSPRCSPVCLGRANDRTDRELPTQKRAWLRHDQVGLEVLASKWRTVQVWKHQPISRIGQRRCIARLVLPGLKVHRLRRRLR
jgi:hypothetical protein